MGRDHYVLGVHFGHNAAVALAGGGQIVAALAEERLRRIKNYTGFPTLAYRWILEHYLGGDPGGLDLVVIPAATPLDFHFYTHRDRFADGRYFDYYHKTERNEIPPFFACGDEAAIRGYQEEDQQRVARLATDEGLRQRMVRFYSEHLGVDATRLRFVEHHTIHACSACLGIDAGREWLIFTLDASGDNVCATVHHWSGGRLERLAAVPRYASLGTFYREVTAFLGLKPDEHEFKVMGLAPYARGPDVQRVYEKFAPLVWVNDRLEFESRFPMELMKYFLLRECVYDRFDFVAAAAQRLLEERVTEWICRWVRRTGIPRVALSGGVFMNVKLNQRIAACDEVQAVYVVPSAGDESLVMGACWYGMRQLSPKQRVAPLQDLSLGPQYSPREVEDALVPVRARYGWEVRRESDIEKRVAELLAQGEVVGRFAGRSEWGARALGNRSLLADPRHPRVVRVINDMIKGRDFWMPFAPSILTEDMPRYVINPKGLFAPYMVISFDSTRLAQEHLPAAMHPYDYTVRPQEVRPDWNPRYYRLIARFRELTGVGAVLNTSFNLHGEPLVESPTDALHVFAQSGLRYLALEDWLVWKPG